MKLTSDERRRIYAGDYRALKRPTKPDVKGGATQVLSWTRGGKQIVDRDNGETIEIPRKPTVWIIFKEPYLKEGRWIVEITGHDNREPTRLLSSAPSGAPRQPGLRTRQREKVPARGTETESWTSETERGYSGSGRTAIDPLEGVNDETLRGFATKARSDRAEFSREMEEENVELSEEARRRRERALKRRLRDALAGLAPGEQVALLAVIEKQIEQAQTAV